MAAGFQFDLNYTYSKSIDVGSNAERVNGFESSGLAFNSQVINAFSPNLWRAASDFDTTHQFNANWVWDLPYGWPPFRKRIQKHLNGVFGGWGLNGLIRWTSGFPFTVEAGNGWSTNFELEGSSVLIGPKPKTGVFIRTAILVYFRIRRASHVPVGRQLPGTRRSALHCREKQDSATISAARASSESILA